MKDSEKKIEPALVKIIEKLGGLCLKMVPLHFTGLPDRICLLPGTIICFCETKTTREKLSERQKFVHKQLRNLNFYVITIDSMSALEEFKNDIQSFSVSGIRH